LREFIEEDPTGRLMRDAVWLAAETHRLTDDNAAYWQWLDGRSTSTPPIISIIIIK